MDKYANPNSFIDDFELVEVVDENEEEVKSKAKVSDSSSVNISKNKSPSSKDNKNSSLISKKAPPETLKHTSVKSDGITDFFNNMVSEMTNAKNSMKYNLITFNSSFDVEKFKFIQIFEKQYNLSTKKDILLFEGDLNYVIWMTYRSNFEPILTSKKVFTTDCGWGCMIRVGQMLLSQAIFRMKIHDIKRQGLLPRELSLYRDTMSKLKKNTILLFMDFDLPLGEVKHSRDFKSFIDAYNTEKDFMTTEEYDKLTITPPFSIQNICNTGVVFDKVAGVYFSEHDVINIFEEIVGNLNDFKLGITQFSEGIIYEEAIFEKCFRKVNWECRCGIEENEKNVFEIIENLNLKKTSSAAEDPRSSNAPIVLKNETTNDEDEEFNEYISSGQNAKSIASIAANNASSAISSPLGFVLQERPAQERTEPINQTNSQMIRRKSKSDNNINLSKFEDDFFICSCRTNANPVEILVRENQKFFLINKGVVFLNFRLGLKTINTHYYSQINGFFDIFGNLGLMGGKENLAHYFIGKTDNNHLIYVDPHYNQEAIRSVYDLYVNNGEKSYNTSEYLYTMSIDNMQPSLSVGFGFSSVDEYTRMIRDMKKFQKDYKEPLIKIKFSERSLGMKVYKTSSKNDF